MDKPADWLVGSGPDADLVVMSRCRLFRNLADFPFPNQCTLDEKRVVEERITGCLDSMNLLATGQYYSLGDLDVREKRFLIERRLVNPTLLNSEGPCGVYIADDQSLSITINDADHLTVTGLASGLQPQEVWSRINLIDDTLAGALDFAFSDRLGYLTTSIAHVGTGFKAGALLHLPGLAIANLLGATAEDVATKRHVLENYPDPGRPAAGDLFVLTNTSTLGRSEEETVFHLKHLAGELIEKEKETREQVRSEAPLQLEDRVGRALGIARNARLLASNEADSLLSSLRLGVSSGLLDQFSLQQINDVFIASQNAHIEMKCGHSCDEFQLSAERADLFRARFA